MKFFSIIFAVLAVSSLAKADDHNNGLACILGPLLQLLQPLLDGLNSGLQAGAIKVGKGVKQVGSCLENTVKGVGTIVANTAAGAGGTVKALPAGLYKTTRNLQEKCGLAEDLLNEVTGAVSSSHHHPRKASDSDSPSF